MAEEIMIDVSGCPHKSDDDCMEVPICNEYGDLMGYQSCEAQTLCPYRSQKKIERLEQENRELRKANEISIEKVTVTAEAKRLQELEQESKELNFKINQLKANGLYNDLTGIELSAKVVELKQENKELKEVNEQICKDCSKEIKHYWCILEEIRELVRADCKGCTAECDCDEDCTRYIIKNKINEVLNEKEL